MSVSTERIETTVAVTQVPPTTLVIEGTDTIVAVASPPIVSVIMPVPVATMLLILPPPSTVVVDAPIAHDVVQVGLPGPPGPQGDPGPPGAAGSAPQAYTHAQIVPSDTWTVVHGLGFYPNVTVLDSLGEIVAGDVDYPDTASVVLRFSAAFGGTAYLS